MILIVGFLFGINLKRLMNNLPIQYLFHSTLPHSPALHIVDSFSANDKNYEKIVAAIKDRFGREDLHIKRK